MKNSKWTIVLGVIAFLALVSMVWASPPPDVPLVPPQASPGFDADMVDGHHAGASGGAVSQRKNRVLWAGSNGKFSLKAIPVPQLNNRYLNDDRQERIEAAVAGPLLAVRNTGAGDSLRVNSEKGMAIEVVKAGQDGIRVSSANWSGVWVGSSGYDAIRVQTAGQDGLRFFDAMGRDYIRAGNDGALEFRVTSNGTAYADGGWKGAADFAELMTTEGDVADYEPGDVLVISAQLNRSVAPSFEPYSTMVVGVYSEKPGFVGSSNHMDGQRDDEIAVAVMGIVSCKVSAENGPLSRGDLLVTSSTPGHAMRADNPPPGTILGKALEPLEEGTGVILVLVTLQ